MSFIIAMHPYPDESLAGLIVRATARDFYRNPLRELRAVDIVTTTPQSLCTRSPALAQPIAKLIGCSETHAIALCSIPLSRAVMAGLTFLASRSRLSTETAAGGEWHPEL